LWHYFGTNQSGGDVAAGVISGARVAMLTAGTVLVISGVLGVLMGGIAGYFGDRQLSIPRWRLLSIIIFLVLAFVFCFWVRLPILQYGSPTDFWRYGADYFLLSSLVFVALLYLTRSFAFWGKSIAFPADFLIMRVVEIFDSIPKLILVTVVAALSTANPSLYMIIAIIALFSWMGIATFIRGQLLRVRELKYLDAAKVLGIRDGTILLRHALPSAIKPAAIAFALSAGSAILLESSISFIGFTSDPNMVSWGKLLLEARIHPTAWWLALFPGAMLSFTVYYLYKIGRG
jgi:peptide/nickel transport system permease protein